MRFAPGEFYHIYNRGVEGRNIFLEKDDYLRFLKGLAAFNSDIPIILNRVYDEEIRSLQENKLAAVVSYCLMKNHIHLLARCEDEVKLALFLQKIFIGYTMYFNIKYQRSGVLFQGRSKSKHIDNDTYLKHVIDYIHLNPLDYSFHKWRNHKIKKLRKARDVIIQYPWSSLSQLLDKNSNSAILDTKLVDELFSNRSELLSSALEWSSETFQNNSDMFLEAV